MLPSPVNFWHFQRRRRQQDGRQTSSPFYPYHGYHCPVFLLHGITMSSYPTSTHSNMICECEENHEESTVSSSSSSSRYHHHQPTAPQQQQFQEQCSVCMYTGIAVCSGLSLYFVKLATEGSSITMPKQQLQQHRGFLWMCSAGWAVAGVYRWYLG